MPVYEQKDPKTGLTAWYYDFRWRDPRTGKTRRVRSRARDEKQRLVKSETAARAAEQRRRTELAGEAYRPTETAPEPTEVVTLGGFKERYFADHVGKREQSMQSAQETIWREHLLPVLKSVPIADIDQAHYAQVATAMRKKGRGKKTTNNALSALRTALTCANQWGLRGPVAQVAWEKPAEVAIQWFDDAAIDQIVAVGDPMVVFAVKTGLRIGELLALKWGDIDMKRKTVTVQRSVYWEKSEAHEKSTKSGRIRTVPLPPSAMEALGKVTRGLPAAYVFTDEAGLQMTRNGAKWPLWRVCDKAGLERCGWHRLRHSYISALVRKNVPINQVQRLAGHSTVQMTLRYAHVADAELERAVSVLA